MKTKINPVFGIEIECAYNPKIIPKMKILTKDENSKWTFMIKWPNKNKVNAIIKGMAATSMVLIIAFT